MMLGFLLARAGVNVVVLERHEDFLRDFRGDTIHPSTLQVIDELGLIAEFLSLPHHKVDRVGAVFGEAELKLADFRTLPVEHRYIAFMPQWDFLNFIAEHASAYPEFELRMPCEALRLVVREGLVRGLVVRGPQGEEEIRADLVVAADGRDSTLRAQSGLPVRDLGAPMDVLWFRLERPADHPNQPLGRFLAGKILVMLDRGDYWQCGYVIPKGLLDGLREQPFEVFRRDLAKLLPGLEPQLQALRGWQAMHLLTVQVNRLEKWWLPGLLCIGDAAHAMSPVGGVGINLAIQDAVAAANVLAGPLLAGRVEAGDLQRIQRRRQWPTVATQRLQLAMQNRVISRVLHEKDQIEPPLALRLLQGLPFMRRLPARIIGLGILPEHVRTPERG